ncbi:DUF1707 domain-containing protein [Actinocrinis puniceicyclus]|uniref:DUF1707 domain-containing protein n=1 Tax=Actinocrinis puniceicyclus TaxID=977794 RepID=A0A8J7WHC5_9ACTN|nr:DUF1707 domain-containing protein [Actinocrinis puniceicyclus]MBS2962251.1 DUF1707 domain-containing protein [Actinocrinis puniceicyclus]
MSVEPRSDHDVHRGGDGTGSVRASDAEREAALRALATHFADGRLERAEFDERADAALAARTREQLRALFTDLPTQAPASEPRRAPDLAARGVALPAGPLLFLVPVLFVFAVVAAMHGAPPVPLALLAFVLMRRHRRLNR